MVVLRALRRVHVQQRRRRHSAWSLEKVDGIGGYRPRTIIKASQCTSFMSNARRIVVTNAEDAAKGPHRSLTFPAPLHFFFDLSTGIEYAARPRLTTTEAPASA